MCSLRKRQHHLFIVVPLFIPSRLWFSSTPAFSYFNFPLLCVSDALSSLGCSTDSRCLHIQFVCFNLLCVCVCMWHCNCVRLCGPCLLCKYSGTQSRVKKLHGHKAQGAGIIMYMYNYLLTGVRSRCSCHVNCN